MLFQRTEQRNADWTWSQPCVRRRRLCCWTNSCPLTQTEDCLTLAQKTDLLSWSHWHVCTNVDSAVTHWFTSEMRKSLICRLTPVICIDITPYHGPVNPLPGNPSASRWVRRVVSRIQTHAASRHLWSQTTIEESFRSLFVSQAHSHDTNILCRFAPLFVIGEECLAEFVPGKHFRKIHEEGLR